MTSPSAAPAPVPLTEPVPTFRQGGIHPGPKVATS